MSVPKYIYRMAHPTIDEKNRFYAEDDQDAVRVATNFGVSPDVTIQLIGEIAEDKFGPYSKLYPRWITVTAWPPKGHCLEDIY